MTKSKLHTRIVTHTEDNEVFLFQYVYNFVRNHIESTVFLSGGKLDRYIANVVMSKSKHADLIEGLIRKLTTEEVEQIVLDFDSTFRKYYKDDFNTKFFQLGDYLDEMENKRNGSFSRHLIKDSEMRNILDKTLKLSDDAYARFANKINGQDILIIDDTISRGQSIKEICSIIQESYAPKSITVLTLLSKLNEN